MTNAIAGYTLTMKNEDDVNDRAGVLSDTFGISAETARATAADNAASGMRKPASDQVELERIAAAKEAGTVADRSDAEE